MPESRNTDTNEAAAGSRSRSSRRIVVAAVLLILIAGGGAYYLYGSRFFAPSETASAAATTAIPALPVTVSAPLLKEITEWDEFTGQFTAVDYVEIRARVSGYLTEIHFEDGQIVRKGDLLFVIDPRPYEAILA